jgi:hypothetical protein
MDERIRQLIEQIPEKPPRSVLQPHVHLIRQLRRKRLTYRAIARLLHAEYGVSVHWTTIHSFLKVRARRRCDEIRPKYELPDEGAAEPSPVHREATFGAPPAAQFRTAAEQAAFFEELKRRKRTPPPPPPKSAFHYEPGEPLRLITDADELEKSTALVEKLRKGTQTGGQ